MPQFLLVFPLIRPSPEPNKPLLRKTLGKIRRRSPRFWLIRVAIRSTERVLELVYAALPLATSILL